MMNEPEPSKMRDRAERLEALYNEIERLDSAALPTAIGTPGLTEEQRAKLYGLEDKLDEVKEAVGVSATNLRKQAEKIEEND